MPIALLKVVFLRTVDNAKSRGPSTTAKRGWRILSGTETMLLFMLYQPYDVAFYAVRHFMLISCGKKLKSIFLQKTSFFRCGLSSWMFPSCQNTQWYLLDLSVLYKVGFGMEMDSYKSWILDGVLMVLVHKQNHMSPCLKLHASVSHFFGNKCTHSCVPGLKEETLFSELSSFFRCVCQL